MDSRLVFLRPLGLRLLGVIEHPELKPVADDAGARLDRVATALTA